MPTIHRRLALVLAGICAATGLLVADAATDALFNETSSLRELPIRRPVRSRTLSRGEIERKVIAAFDRQMKPDQARASELAMQKLGLLPADFDLRTFQIAMLTEQLAGLYDPEAREFYLADWIDITAQQPVIVHELTHALQDQHFDLRRLSRWPDGDGDARFAVHSLVEGDATVAMSHYLVRNPEAAAAFMRWVQDTPKMPVLEGAPRALRDSLLFPFNQGSQFAAALYARGGWKAVSAAYERLPQSTEQILHVEKYDAREAPVAVTLPDVASLLGTGWKRLHSDVSGEWSYYVLLDQFLASPGESRRAAAGWGGDRLDIYRGPDGSLVSQRTVWDTQDDAREFLDAYTTRTLLRYPGATAETGATDRRFWRTGEGGVAIERRGAEVTIVEGIPGAADRQALMQALWR
jgi:hypothetical protein